MDELDLLKKDWKRDKGFRQVSEEEIYKMLHQKSSSIVKWILIISILEMVLWTGLNFIGSSEDYLQEHSDSLLVWCFEALQWINYPIVLVFIFLFYKNYRRISATDSTRLLMKHILRTRKTVNNYVWYNLGMITLAIVMSIVIILKYKPDIPKLSDDPGKMALLFIVLAVFTIVFVGALWLFYRLIYGMLLKRLMSNYKELEKIEL